MKRVVFSRPTRLIALIGLLVLLPVLAVACGTQVAPIAQPASTSVDQAEVLALVVESVKSALEEAAGEPREEVSREELILLIKEAVAEASSDEAANSVTKAEVEQLIQAEIRPLQQALGVAPAPPLEVGKPTIVFSDLTRNSARIQTQIAMFIVEHGYGYPVDRISGDALVLWDHLLDGVSLVTMEVWLPNQQEAWNAAVIDGAVIPLGKSLDKNWQGWVVPTYLNKFRIPRDVGDINDEDYIDLFVAPEKRFERPQKAVFVNCPLGTACHDINVAKLKAYGLEKDVELVVPSSFDELQANLERAYAKEDPWLGYMWGPSRLSDQLDLTILEEPEYSEECWVTNQGCAYPVATVHIAIHPSMLSIAPDLVEFLRNWDFTASRLTKTERWMSNNDATLEETAVYYLQTWPQDWTQWVPDEVSQKVHAGIAQENASADFDVAPCAMTRAVQIPIEFEYKGTTPTGFDGINSANCTFTKPVKTVTVVLSGPGTYIEKFFFSEPTDRLPFPLPGDTLSTTTREVVLPGEYLREITVTSIDGEVLVLSDQPGVLKSVTVLKP